MIRRPQEYQAGSAQPFQGPDIEYRLSRQYRRPALMRFISTVVLAVVCVVTPLAFLDAGAAIFGALAVYFGATYVWRGRFRTRVTSRGIEVHGYFNRFVPWDEVRDIEVTGFGSDQTGPGENIGAPQYTRMPGSLLGSSRAILPAPGTGMSRLASIAIVRADGHKVQLRAPVVSGWADDPDFDEKARQLEQLCTRYARGAIA
jgi:hypothetical protein